MLRKALILAAGLAALPLMATEFVEVIKKIDGVYMIYGGGLGDTLAPTPTDKKIMFSLKGSAAKEMFEGMGPDYQDACEVEPGERVRQKDNGNVYCRRSPEGEYKCNFGFDLRTGKSIGGSVC